MCNVGVLASKLFVKRCDSINWTNVNKHHICYFATQNLHYHVEYIVANCDSKHLETVLEQDYNMIFLISPDGYFYFVL